MGENEPEKMQWGENISDELLYGRPVSFSRNRLKNQKDLFSHRNALFYTPTRNIPAEFIGVGPFTVTLPIAAPGCIGFRENPGYFSPRLWVDLIQRQTGKIRWKPIMPAHVAFVRYDSSLLPDWNLAPSIKALLDAFKVSTTGRRDGRLLYYFGAIVDDASDFITLSLDQESVAHPRDSKITVRVTGVKGATQ